MLIIDLETAKLHMRIDGDHEDALVALYVSAAEDQAVQFLGRNVYPDADSAAAAMVQGDLTALPVNASVEAAVLLLAAHLYANREAVAPQGSNAQVLPMGAHALLWPYRMGLGV